MLLQAITTKYYGPGNVRGSRFIAKAAAGQLSFAYDPKLGADGSSAAAAKALAVKYRWQGLYVAGHLPDGSRVYVCAGDWRWPEREAEQSHLDAGTENRDWFFVDAREFQP